MKVKSEAQFFLQYISYSSGFAPKMPRTEPIRPDWCHRSLGQAQSCRRCTKKGSDNRNPAGFVLSEPRMGEIHADWLCPSCRQCLRKNFGLILSRMSLLPRFPALLAYLPPNRTYTSPCIRLSICNIILLDTSLDFCVTLQIVTWGCFTICFAGISLIIEYPVLGFFSLVYKRNGKEIVLAVCFNDFSH